MATQTIEMESTSGQTLTMYVYALGSDTLIDSASATEATNRKGLYSAAFTDLAAGTYRVSLRDASDNVFATQYAKTSSATATFQAWDIKPGFDVNILSTSLSASETSDGLDGTTISKRRGDRWSISFTGLGAVTSYNNIWFTAKDAGDWADTESLVQIDTDTGLLVINCGTAGTAANGSITVDDAGNGDLTIVLEEVETAKLPVTTGKYDIQLLDSSNNISTLTEGTFTVLQDTTRATS